MKTLVDQGSLVNVLFLKTFKKMGLSADMVLLVDFVLLFIFIEKNKFINVETKFIKENDFRKK